LKILRDKFALNKDEYSSVDTENKKLIEEKSITIENLKKEINQLKIDKEKAESGKSTKNMNYAP
jgi:hypothetical protein